MTEREALKLALEALETKGEHHPRVYQAMTAIKKALAQPEQGPVAFVKGCNRGQWEIFPAKAYQIFEREQPLYTTPPQRPWVGLTPQERDEINERVYGAVPHHVAFHAAIDQALREKNT